MNYIIFLPLCLALGVMVKLTDLLEDNVKSMSKQHKLFNIISGINATRIPFNIILGILYGTLMFSICYLFPVFTVVVLATVIAMLLFGKIDAPGHYAGVGIFLILYVLIGLADVNYLYLIIFIAANFAEEYINNELVDKKRVKNKLVRRVLSVRPVLEITVFAVAFYSGLWQMFFGLLAFDIGYNLTAMYGAEKQR